MLIPTRVSRSIRNGFSLIEVVLAIGVISFALVAIIGAFSTGLIANRASISDTRAGELANAVFATIDAQASSFAAVQCYGLSLDLTKLTTGDTSTLYANYPSPNEPGISTSPINSIYSLEMKFDNDPAMTTGGAKLGAGKLNKIQLRISGKSKAEGVVELFYIVRNKG